MASEDSDEVSARRLAVHGLSDLGDAHKPFRAEMHAAIHELYAARELLEVRLLRGV